MLDRVLNHESIIGISYVVDTPPDLDLEDSCVYESETVTLGDWVTDKGCRQEGLARVEGRGLPNQQSTPYADSSRG